MFKKIFTKYFMITSLVILISFYVLGVTLFFFFSQYTMNEKRKTMVDNGELTAYNIGLFVEQLQDNITNHDYATAVEATINNHLLSVSNALEVHIVVALQNGSILFCSNRDVSGCTAHAGLVPEDFIESVRLNGTVSQTTNLNGFFDKKQLVVGLPLNINDSMGLSQFRGVVILASDTQFSSRFLMDIARLFFLSSLMVMGVDCVALYFVTRRLVKPLWAMNNAAKKLAKGNFDVSVPVKGDDEVSELAIAFNNMASSLKQLEDMRRSFIWSVSHELKTPMTVINGFVEGILDGTIPPEKQHQYLDTVHAEILRLSRLVQDLLELSRIEAGTKKLNVVTFDICEMLTRIMLSYEKRISEKHIQVEFDIPQEVIQVRGDMDDLYRVAYNLIDNAVKFTNENGLIQVGVVLNDKKAFVSVKNSGQGINAEDIKHVFERFYKSDKSRSLDRTGIGLGLHIVKTILDMHGEEIWVKSTEGEYCEFVFTIARSGKKEERQEKKNRLPEGENASGKEESKKDSEA